MVPVPPEVWALAAAVLAVLLLIAVWCWLGAEMENLRNRRRAEEWENKFWNALAEQQDLLDEYSPRRRLPPP